MKRKVGGSNLYSTPAVGRQITYFMLLAINTASSQTAIALLKSGSVDCKPGQILGEKSWKSTNDEAEKLMPAIEKMLKESGAKYDDLKQVVVIKGPGSFTGLRVGVTVANTIANLVGADLYGFDTFSYFWHLREDKPDLDAILVFAGSQGVYLSLPDDCPDFIAKVRNINVEDLDNELQRHKIKIVTGDITDQQKKFIRNAKYIDLDETFGEKMSHMELERLTPTKIVEPIYIKKPGITLSKKKLTD